MISNINSKSLDDIFTYHDSVIRVVGDVDEPWFNGKDIATVLGYTDTQQAIRKNVDEEDKTIFKKLPGLADRANNSSHNAVWINESGLYSLIFSSKLESAKQFRRWVTSEVLPSIRKKGQFIHDEKIKVLENEVIESKRQRVLSKAPHIKLTDRLINHHKFMTRGEYEYIYKNRSIGINNRIVTVKHPDHGRFKAYLLKLSKQISASMRQLTNKNPDITYKNRSNLYTKQMYEEYIDDILNMYTLEHPLESIKIQWDWYINDSDYEDDDRGESYSDIDELEVEIKDIVF